MRACLARKCKLLLMVVLMLSLDSQIRSSTSAGTTFPLPDDVSQMPSTERWQLGDAYFGQLLLPGTQE